MKIRMLAAALAIMAALTAPNTTAGEPAKAQADQVQEVRQMCDQYEAKNGLKAIDSADLTREIITHRKGKKHLLTERVISIATSPTDGKVLNSGENPYYYISYPDFIGAKAGDIIVTYVTYNPSNNYVDDVIGRYDLALYEIR